MYSNEWVINNKWRFTSLLQLYQLIKQSENFTTLSNCLNKVNILGKIQGKFGKRLGNIQEKHLGEIFRKTFEGNI